MYMCVCVCVYVCMCMCVYAIDVHKLFLYIDGVCVCIIHRAREKVSL